MNRHRLWKWHFLGEGGGSFAFHSRNYFVILSVGHLELSNRSHEVRIQLRGSVVSTAFHFPPRQTFFLSVSPLLLKVNLNKGFLITRSGWSQFRPDDTHGCPDGVHLPQRPGVCFPTKFTREVSGWTFNKRVLQNFEGQMGV